MGLLALMYLNDKIFFTCKSCNAHLTPLDQLISKEYRGSSGKAYLFNDVINVVCGELEDKLLLSGLHTTCDIFCLCCMTKVGWKYEIAHDEKNKFKEGRFVLERALISRCKEN